jgi:citrate lyase beta subunit
MTDAKTHPMRSWLFTPAMRPERFEKATNVGADVLIIDLENSVAPAHKACARSSALDHLALPQAVATATALRVNGARPVTTWRIDTRYVVIELGAANLKGRSSTERAQALINLAHFQFRDELTKAAREMHLI